MHADALKKQHTRVLAGEKAHEQIPAPNPYWLGVKAS